MFKKVLLYTLSIFLLVCNLISAEDVTNDLANNNILEGKISKQTTVWRIDFNYEDKIIKGEFNRAAPSKLPKNRYKIELEINDKLYEGSIFYLLSLFQNNSYEVDIDCDGARLTGKIEKNYKKVYKRHSFKLRYDNKTKFLGEIIYERKDEAKNFNFTLGDKKITGRIFTETRGINSTKKINFKFDDKRLSGVIERKVGYEQYTIQTDQLSDEDLFVFFFFMIFLEIDDYNEEIKNQ